MKKLIILIILGGVIVLGVTKHAKALMVESFFGGTLTSVWESFDRFDGIIDVGTRFTGRLAYDTESPVDFYTENGATYSSPENYISFSIIGTNEVFTISSGLGGESGGISVNNDHSSGVDFFDIPYILEFSDSIKGYQVSEAGLRLLDSTATVFNNTALPTALDFSDFDSGSIGIWSDSDLTAAFVMLGSIETFSSINQEPTPVPEPVTILLLGFGLAVLAGLNRKISFKKS